MPAMGIIDREEGWAGRKRISTLIRTRTCGRKYNYLLLGGLHSEYKEQDRRRRENKETEALEPVQLDFLQVISLVYSKSTLGDQSLSLTQTYRGNANSSDVD